MRTAFPIIALLFALPTAAGAQSAPTAQPSTRPIQIGTSYTMSSPTLGDTREVNIWLPNGYDRSTDTYPVLYLLDGALDQDFHHIAGLGSLASLSWTYGPFIVVGVQTRDRAAELTPRPTDPRYRAAFPNSGGADRFRRFLHQEVIPFVEARYRTSSKRALMGESLAGLFVVDTLLEEPKLFDDYIAISPSLWWDDRRPLRRPAPTGLAQTRLFLAIADEGGTMQDGVDRLRRSLGQLPAGRITVKYVDYSSTATHSTVYHRAAEEALRWLYPAPPYKSAPTPWYMIEGAAPPSKR
ncbi:alpha/beta hydrolase [Sphingomonas sp. PB4P5]|uniref:alpha/beta hydrolase n=1 Tax=Parasphingomonas puruogangriensis TaxID=3096155 RepID=UPI002FCB34B4